LALMPQGPPAKSPPTNTSTPGSADCASKFQCVYGAIGAVPSKPGVSSGGPGLINYVMNVCLPKQGYGSATCSLDTVMPGETKVASSSTCDPPKDHNDLEKQCKELNGRRVTPSQQVPQPDAAPSPEVAVGDPEKPAPPGPEIALGSPA